MVLHLQCLHSPYIMSCLYIPWCMRHLAGKSCRDCRIADVSMVFCACGCVRTVSGLGDGLHFFSLSAASKHETACCPAGSLALSSPACLGLRNWTAQVRGHAASRSTAPLLFINARSINASSQSTLCVAPAVQVLWLEVPRHVSA